jgi:outer membrane protein TolC
MPPTSTSPFRSISGLLTLAMVAASTPALAQPKPEPPQAEEPDPVAEPDLAPVPSPNPDGADAPKPAPKPPPVKLDPTNPHIDDAMLEAIKASEGGELTRDILSEALAPQPNGLQPDDVVAKAVTTSASVAASRAEIAEASARLDQAFAAYFPRLTLMASYTRVNEVDLTIPGFPGGGFPQQLNQYALSAGLEVPVSDYILRLTQAYSAASADVESRELQTEAKRIEVRAQAKAAYFNWVRAQGRAVVTGMSTALSRRHLEDAQATFAAGVISGADVSRFEARVAQARHFLNSAIGAERVLAMQLRRIMHVELDAPLVIGIDVMTAPPDKQKRTLPQLLDLAQRSRLDLKALRRSVKTFEGIESTTRAGYYPKLTGFANGLYASPNPRVITSTDFAFTWNLGARLSWTINDTFQTMGAVAEAEAKTAQVSEQLRAVEDSVVLAVTASYYDIETARSAIDAAEKREEAAKKSLDARRKLFRGGRATATDIIDSEAELFEARLQRVDAHVNVLVGRANLEQSVGARLY